MQALQDGLELAAAMRDYGGSVAVDARSRTAAVTSPRGDLVGFWDIDTGALRGHYAFDDVCGVAVSTDSTFVLSGSNGQVRSVDATTLADARDARERFDGVRWDNHMIALPGSRTSP